MQIASAVSESLGMHLSRQSQVSMFFATWPLELPPGLPAKPIAQMPSGHCGIIVHQGSMVPPCPVFAMPSLNSSRRSDRCLGPDLFHALFEFSPSRTLIASLASAIAPEGTDPLVRSITDLNEKSVPVQEARAVLWIRVDSNDVTKTNLTTSLEQRRLETVRSL